ncbi:MAG: hypothetical protein BalsKO_22690 [Balneolaceae bacterium]
MKALLLILFLGVSSTLSPAQVLNTFLGNWEGSGTLMGKEGSFEMKWEQVLNDEFLKLNFKNGFSDGSFSMEATAFYKLTADSTFSGFWFDSRGVSFPLNGSYTFNSITTEWENPGVEKGRTEYKFLESGEIRVFDFVFRNGTYQKFATATYQQKE